MIRKSFLWAVGLSVSSLCLSASAAVFNLRSGVDGILDGGTNLFITSGGITATLTALVNDLPAGVLNGTAGGFGVNAPLNGAPNDATDLLDAVDGSESIRITFNHPVYFEGLTLSLFSLPTQSPPLGDGADLLLPDLTYNLIPQTSASDPYSTPILNRVDMGEAVVLKWTVGAGFSFDNFAAHVVPLPAAAWGGLAMLGGLAIRRHRRMA